MFDLGSKIVSGTTVALHSEHKTNITAVQPPKLTLEIVHAHEGVLISP